MYPRCMGRRGTATPPTLPPSFTHCWHPLPLHAMWHVNRGVKRGWGNANTQFAFPLPDLCNPCWCPPPLHDMQGREHTIPPPPLHGVGTTPFLCANRECRAVHKGKPPPFPPLSLLRLNRTPSAGPPATPPLTPLFMHKQGLIHAPTRHGNAGAWHNPPPLVSHSPKQA